MKTLRIGTFETNSSSCHVIQLMNTKDWEDFKSGQLLIKKAPFDGKIEEHNDVTVDLRGCSDNFSWTSCFMSADDFVNDFYKNIEENKEEICERFAHIEDDFYEFKKQIFNFVINPSNKDIVKKVLLEETLSDFGDKFESQQYESSLLVKFKKPITITYSDYKRQKITNIYKGITADNVYDFLFDYDDRLNITLEDSIWGKAFPMFYSYNDDTGWKNAQVTNFVQKEKNEKGISYINKDIELTIVDRWEEC